MTARRGGAEVGPLARQGSGNPLRERYPGDSAVRTGGAGASAGRAAAGHSELSRRRRDGSACRLSGGAAAAKLKDTVDRDVYALSRYVDARPARFAAP